MTASQPDEGMPFADVGPEGDYLKAKQAVQLLKAERDTLSKDLRPKHPKIIRLNDEIDKQEKLIDPLPAGRGREARDSAASRSGSRWKTSNPTLRNGKRRLLDLSQQLAQFNRLKGKVERQKTLYDRLTNNL